MPKRKRETEPAPNVFLPWAGERSRQVAQAFRQWLPSVLQAARPWMSESDIEKGAPWDATLNFALSECSIGVIFVTVETLKSQWVSSESGSLARAIGGRVCTVLLDDLKPSDVTGPLSRYQHTRTTKDDFRTLMLTIWKALGRPIEQEHLIKAFERSWPDLEPHLVPTAPPTVPAPKREPGELLEETLAGVRELLFRVSKPRLYKIPRPITLETEKERRRAIIEAVLSHPSLRELPQAAMAHLRIAMWKTLAGDDDDDDDGGTPPPGFSLAG